MKQKEKIDKIVSYAQEQGDTCMMDASVDGVIVNAAILIPEKRIIIFDVPTEKEEDVYQSCVGKKLHVFFMRQSEGIDFTMEKLQNLYKWEWRRTHKTPQQIFNRGLNEFLESKKGWQKLTQHARQDIYKREPVNFYKEFIDRQKNQFDGDFDKTLLSFGDQLMPEFRPKPKPKRQRVRIPHGVKIEPHGKRA